MAVNFADPPIDSERAKHRQIGSLIGRIGIKQRAVPIEKHYTRKD